MTKEIIKTKWKDLSQSNLTPPQMEALKSLQQNKNITIKPSDKGGNLVIMDNCQYESMVMAIVRNREWYRKVSPNHLTLTTTRYQHLIGSAYQKGLINKNTWEFLNVTSHQKPTLYALPKIHKNPIKPPGRPIVSGNGCLTETASQLIDDFLRPHVEGMVSYLQDTSDLLHILDGIFIPQGSWLVALDIEALYNSIPHQLGVDVVEGLISENPEAPKQYNKLILDLLLFILSNNIFLFGGSHYLQVQGLAMGTKCAPTYANLYLGGWERELFFRGDMQTCFEQIPV